MKKFLQIGLLLFFLFLTEYSISQSVVADMHTSAPNNTICRNDPFTLYMTPSQSIRYVFQYSVNGGAWTDYTTLSSDATIGNEVSQTITLVDNTQFRVKYTTDLSVGSVPNTIDPTTISITVNQLPTVATITGASNTVCQNSDITYSNTTAAGVWTTSNSNVATVGASTGIVHGVAQGFAFIKYIVTDQVTGCKKQDAKMVTVNPTPSVASIIDAVCSGIQYTKDPSLTPGNFVPIGTTYDWSLPSTSAVGLTGTASGTAQSNINALLTNTTISNITATYTITATKGSCVSNPFNLTLTVTSKPYITNRPVINSCSGSSFSDPISNGNGNIVPSGITYSWTAPSVPTGINNQSASGTPSPTIFSGLLNNSTNGTLTVSYTVNTYNSGCQGSTFTETVTVNPTPSITAKTTTICSNTNFSITIPTGLDIVPVGTTYTWSAPVVSNVNGLQAGSNLSSVSGTLSNTTNAPIDVTYVITPTAGNCQGANFNAVVTINPVPSISNMGPTQTGSGSLFNFVLGTGSDIIPAGTTYSWPIPNMQTGITGGAASGTPSPTSLVGTLTNPTGTYLDATYTITPSKNNCFGNTFNYVVRVYPKPIIGLKQVTICSRQPFSVYLTDGVGGDVVPNGTTYSWDAPEVAGVTGTASGTAQAFVSGTISNLTNNPIIVDYSVTPFANPQAGDPFIVRVTLNPEPIIADKSIELCSSLGFNYDPSTVGSNIIPNGTTYSWSFINNTNIQTPSNGSGLASIVQSALTNISSTTQTTTYTVTPVSSTGCTGATFNIPLTLNPKPQIADITATTICSGGSMTVTPTSSGSNIIPSGTLYSWIFTPNTNLSGQSAVNSQTSIVQSPLTNLTNSPQTINYTVTPSTLKCSGSTFQVSQLVNPIVTIASNTISTCSGISFTSSPTNNGSDIVPGGTTYTWTIASSAVSGTASQATAQSSISQLLTNNTNSQKSAQYFVTANPNNTCQSSNYTLTVNVDPTPVYANTSISTVCSGAGFTYTPTNSGSNIIPAGTTYTWTIPTNTSFSGISNVSNGQSTITQVPANLTSGALTLTYSVSATTALGCSIAQPFSLSVPVLPTARITTKLPSAICSGSLFTFPLVDGQNGDVIPSNTLYTWVVSNNGNLNGQANQVSTASGISQTLSNTTNTNQQVVYTVTPVLSNNCPANTFTATASVNPMPSIASNSDAICSDANYTKTYVNGNGDIVPADIQYIWTRTPVNNSITGQTDQITYTNSITQLLHNTTNGDQIQNYTITPKTQAGCTGSNFNLALNAKPIPQILSNATGVTSCSGSAFSAFQPVNGTNNDIVPTGTQYTWTVSNNTKLTGQSNQAIPQNSVVQTITNTSNSNQSIDYSVRATAPNQCFSVFNLNFISKPVSTISNISKAICTNSSFDATPTSVNTNNIIPANTTYTWTVGTNTNITGAQNQNTGIATISQLLTSTASSQQSITYHVQPILYNQCATAAFDAVISVNPLPVVTTTATSTALCLGGATTLSGAGAISYTWTGGITDATSFVPTQTGTLTYTVTGTDANNCQNTAQQSIEVNPLAVVASIQNGERCGPGIVSLSATTAGQSIKWYDQATGGTLLFTGNNYATPSINATTNYYADAITNKGCMASTRSLVVATIKRVPIVSTTTGSEVCGGGAMSLNATADIGTIKWYDQAIGGNLLGSTSTIQTSNLTATSNYYAEAVYNGCSSYTRTSVQALVRTIPTFTNVSLVEVCYPNTIDISKDTLIKSSTSTLTYSYWKDATALQVIASPTTINQTGIYYIKGTDVYNCASINPISLRINALPAKVNVTDLSYCQFKTIDPIKLSSDANAFLRWYVGGQVYNQALPPLPDSSKPGNYLYEVTQVYNTTKCESLKSAFNLVVHQLPTVTTNASKNPICLNDTLILNGRGAVSYTWDKAVVDSTPFVIRGSDLFHVIGTDQYGCQNTDSIQINTLELPEIAAIPDVFYVCVGNSINVTNYVSKGEPPYKYFFGADPFYLSTNQLGNVASILNGDQNLRFYVVDMNGCKSVYSNTAQIKAYNPVPSVLINQQAFFNEATIIKTKLDSGYTKYVWQPMVNLNFYDNKNPTFTGEAGVVYTLLRQDTLTKCMVVDTYNIDVTEEFIFNVPTAFTPNNDGLNDALKIVKNAGILKINYFKIFNRNGVMVYSSTDVNEAWDGKFKNVLQEPDSFYWIAEYVTKLNNVVKKNGYTTIIR